MKASIVMIGVLALAGGCTHQLTTPTESSSIAPPPATASSAQPADPEVTPRHPDAPNRSARSLERFPAGFTSVSLAEFSNQYEAAGSPRVAILFNRQFGSQLTSWTMESTGVFQETRTVQVEVDSDRSSVMADAIAVERSESFQQYREGDTRQGFSSESIEWKFRDGFSAPFASMGVTLIDSDLVIQAAERGTDLENRRQRISDVNMNLAAMKEKTDWIVEVLMIPDSRSASGYLFRAEAKDLASGSILASAMTDLDDFKDRPVRRKITAIPGGYRIEEEELPAPSLQEYAEDLAIRLLSELSKSLRG